jgi:hypothetical protein
VINCDLTVLIPQSSSTISIQQLTISLPYFQQIFRTMYPGIEFGNVLVNGWLQPITFDVRGIPFGSHSKNLNMQDRLSTRKTWSSRLPMQRLPGVLISHKRSLWTRLMGEYLQRLYSASLLIRTRSPIEVDVLLSRIPYHGKRPNTVLLETGNACVRCTFHCRRL